MSNKRFIASIGKMLLGIILIAFGAINLIDSFWTGMGSAFLFVGVLQLIRQIRYKTNPEYQEKANIEAKDERNRYLSMKAWSITGYIFVIASGAATILLKLAGEEKLMMLASTNVCVMILIYWIAYFILRKKY